MPGSVLGNMPSRNAIKVYVEKGFYHIYNRGVNKSDIFLEKKDYQVFLNYIKLYLLPKEECLSLVKSLPLPFKIKFKKIRSIARLNNFCQRIKLFSFVLMPNHFHFLLQQEDKNDINEFIKSLLTKYAMYFNKKYNRTGPLFQGRYKAILIEKEEYFLHLSRYIHLNPREILSKNGNLISYPWSSYPFYVKNYKAKWLQKDLILSYFKKTKGFGFFSYQGFVEGYKEKEEDIKIMKKYLIDF